MRKKTIGEVLKLARTNQGLSLEELAKKTDIQENLLEAIERNDYDLLPSPFYARSFLRKYAWAVDLDEEIILEAYEAGEMLVYDEIELAADQDYRSRKNKHKRSFLPLFYFVLVALAILAFVTYYIWNFTQNADSSLDPSASYSLVDSDTGGTSSSPESSSQASSSSASSVSSKLKVEGGDSQLQARYSGAQNAVTLSFSVTDESVWLSVSDTELADGLTLSPEHSSQSLSLEPGASVVISLGQIKGLTITVDGEKLDTSALTSDSGAISLTIDQE